MARVEDAAQIARIFVEAWRDAYAGLLPPSYLVRLNETRQRLLWAREIEKHGPGEGVAVAADSEHGLIGFTSFGPARDQRLGFSGEVYTLYVDPNHQGRGAGRKLIASAFARLYARGHGSCVIWALKGNPARFFYEGEGGKQVGERPGAVGGKPVKEIAFGWHDIAPALWTPAK